MGVPKDELKIIQYLHLTDGIGLNVHALISF